MVENGSSIHWCGYHSTGFLIIGYLYDNSSNQHDKSINEFITKIERTFLGKKWIFAEIDSGNDDSPVYFEWQLWIFNGEIFVIISLDAFAIECHCDFWFNCIQKTKTLLIIFEYELSGPESYPKWCCFGLHLELATQEHVRIFCTVRLDRELVLSIESSIFRRDFAGNHCKSKGKWLWALIFQSNILDKLLL